MNKPPSFPWKQNPRKRIILSLLGVILLPLIALIVAFAWFRISNESAIRRLETEARRAGQPLTLADLERSIPQIPREENAAVALLEIWAEESPDHWNSFIKGQSHLPEREEEHLDPALPFVGAKAKRVSRTEPLSEQSRAAAREFLATNANRFERVRSALARPGWRVPLVITDGYRTLMPHLPQLRNETRNFRVAGIVALENGDVSGSLAAMEDVGCIQRLLAQEPLLVSQLVRVSSAHTILEDSQRLLSRHRLRSSDLVRLEEILQDLDFSGALRSALIAERATGLSVFDSSLTAQQLMTSDELAENAETLDGLKVGMGALQISGLSAVDKRLMLETFGRAIELSGQRDPAELRQFEELFPQVKREARRFPPKIFSGMLLPALQKAGTRFAVFEATRRAALVAVAIERYRDANNDVLPTNLSELQLVPTNATDPFDGSQLRYARRDKGYVIYSIGEDRIDDGGKERTPNSRAKDFDLTFVVER